MITQNEYKKRRETLTAAMKPASIAIIASHQDVTRSNDTHYRFRQNNHFYYLTGFNEPDAILVLINEDTKNHYYLFNRSNNPLQEQWNGKRTGQEGAVTQFLADKAYPIDTFKEKLPLLLENKSMLYYHTGYNKSFDTLIFSTLSDLENKVRKGVSVPDTFCNVNTLIDEMRLIKSDSEIALLEKVCTLSCEAHVNAMKKTKTANFEYELEAELLYRFVQQGCRDAAYESIVASGDNACILHYTENNAPIDKNALILIDAGGELHNYAADITRTFPANGKFTEPQKAIYSLVLKAQLAAIEIIKPGLCWIDIQKTITRILTEGLCTLEILSGDVEQLLEEKAYEPFYMHNSGHWLGLDVHDVGNYKQENQWRSLKAGMVLTVEPGIYIKPSLDVDDKYKGIGVRIEDDVLVTEMGNKVLTASVPKTINDIETLMQ